MLTPEMLGIEEAGAWSIHGSGRILPFGAPSAWYPTVVGYFVCRAATHHRSLPSL
jgi:hypothetical protein